MEAITILSPGHLDYFDSYGLIACQLARHLTRKGIHVNCIPMGDRLSASQPFDVREAIDKPIVPSLGAINLGYPTSFTRHSYPLKQYGPKIAVTMFESTRIPDDWLPALSDMDAVIVPTKFCAEFFRSSGVKIPIHVVSLGIGEIYQYYDRPPDRNPFTFLTFLDRGIRKGGLAAIQAFVRAFGDRDDVRLFVKSRKPRVPSEILNANVRLIQTDLDEQGLYDLYCQCDALINPNMGEGFGLIPREFAATGGIAVTTGWGGTGEDILYWGVPIQYDLVKATWDGHKNLEGRELGMWARPDLDHTAYLLRSIADNREEFRRIGDHGSTWIRNRYSWESFAAGVLAVWRDIGGNYSNRETS